MQSRDDKLREQQDLINEYKSLKNQLYRIKFRILYENLQDYKRVREVIARLNDLKIELELVFSKGDLEAAYDEVYYHGNMHRWDWEIEEAKLIEELSSLELY